MAQTPVTMDDAFIAADLLTFTKSGVRNLSVAITETASPHVREALRKQLNAMIQMHAQVFNYMLTRGLYPAYSTETTIQTDFAKAQMVLAMPVPKR